MVSTNENLLLWEQRINERNNSGMTVTEWCKKKGLSKHKYNYWNHKIINRKEKPVEEMVFTEVTPILSESDNLLSNSNKSDDWLDGEARGIWRKVSVNATEDEMASGVGRR